jgi:hypothetical protein
VLNKERVGICYSYPILHSSNENLWNVCIASGIKCRRQGRACSSCLSTNDALR